MSTSASAEDKAPHQKRPVSRAQATELIKPWTSALEKTRRDVVLVNLRPGTDDPKASKVGGTPFIAEGGDIPKDASGKPMFLLAQINFTEFPKVEGYPESGLLQFFIASDSHYGANFDGELDEALLSQQKNFRVVYQADLTKGAAAKDYPKLPEGDLMLPFDPKKPLSMSFSKTTETISTDDFGFREVFGDEYFQLVEKLAQKSGVNEDSLEEVLFEVLDPNNFSAKVGGYPDFTQEDPRRPGSKRKLLFQLSSHQASDSEVMWGDLGVAGFFITPDDLKSLNFSNVMYTWDCS